MSDKEAMLEAFEEYCENEGITSNQFKEDIYPVFKAGWYSHEEYAG